MAISAQDDVLVPAWLFKSRCMHCAMQKSMLVKVVVCEYDQAGEDGAGGSRGNGR